jgi:hypothetical protein
VSLIACPECAHEVSERAPSCPRCGVPIFRESKVVVHGYTQQFLINPKIRVSWNGAELGSVKKGAVLTHQVAIDGEISFRCNGRKASVPVTAGQVTNIKLSWDRITGKMIPQVVDVVTPGV